MNGYMYVCMDGWMNEWRYVCMYALTGLDLAVSSIATCEGVLIQRAGRGHPNWIRSMEVGFLRYQLWAFCSDSMEAAILAKGPEWCVFLPGLVWHPWL